ncbi:transcriptional regulator, MarR family [Arboricoccus pini]|uniref:Transcriptional regulator, MarR family n=1 Tax=Arboricoccus pini TaxID=1963835 RepID=A0A212RVX2_9PROT|nr:MarR family winged helix-turn-helix transcriptional regulator [Arboricoccus pini]SNB76728.1 transcriptional regulator, MarR family [Arboricoccus pini]
MSAPDPSRFDDRRRRLTPKTIDVSRVEFDIFKDLLSFYARSVVQTLNHDLDAEMAGLPVAKGTGKIATLLLIGANPGIRPSVIAHYILKDRSALARLLDQMQREGLVEQRVQSDERRAHQLYLTDAGEALATHVREIALRQNDRFFAALSAAERQSLLSILKKLYRARVTDLPGSIEP